MGMAVTCLVQIISKFHCAMKQKAGIIIFIFALLWCIAWGLIVSISATSAINTMTMDQLNESLWSTSGSMMILWGLGGVPLGTVIAGIGLLLYINACGNRPTDDPGASHPGYGGHPRRCTHDLHHRAGEAVR